VIRFRGSLRAPLLALGLLALVGVVAIPALAASPSPKAGASASEHPGKGPKASREPEVIVTLKGVVASTKDADGETSYTLTVDGKTVKLDAGPPWFFGDKHPLAPFVGKTVTISGEQSGDEVDVETVDGSAIRAPGKPPWAGGWKAVGSSHPGWSQDKADRWQQKHNGASGAAGATDCWPPGHCKNQGVAAPEASGRPEGP
jgi:hypothetical protein